MTERALPWWLRRRSGAVMTAGAAAIVWTVGWNTATAVVSVSSATATSSVAPRASASVLAHATDPLDPSTAGTRSAGSEVTLGPRITLTPTVAPTAVGTRVTRSSNQRATRGGAPRVTSRTRKDRARIVESTAVSDRAAAEAAMQVPSATDSWTAPLTGPYRITAGFGDRGSLWEKTHTGLDLAAPTGTPVSAVASGEVTAAASAGAFGLRITIRHPDGTETWYTHLSRMDVAAGQVVAGGEVIGAVGATGNVTGPHLHLEIRPDGGEPVDPLSALRARGVTL